MPARQTMLYAVACTHAAQTPLHPELCRYLQGLPQSLPDRPAFYILSRNSTNACMLMILSNIQIKLFGALQGLLGELLDSPGPAHPAQEGAAEQQAERQCCGRL